MTKSTLRNTGRNEVSRIIDDFIANVVKIDTPNELEKSAANILQALKKKPKDGIIVSRSLHFGIYRTGYMQNGIKLFHFRKGEYIRGIITPQNGVVMVYPCGTIRWIYDSWYDDFNYTVEVTQGRMSSGKLPEANWMNLPRPKNL